MGRHRERRTSHQVEPAVLIQDAFAKGDRGNVPFAHGAQGQDHAHSALRQARLIRMGDDGRVHQGGGGEGIFVAEIGADQFLAGLADVAVQIEGRAHLLEPVQEHLARLPVPLLEILVHQGQFGVAGAHVHGQDRGYDPLHAPHLGRVQRSGFGGHLERTDHHTPRLGLQPHRQNLKQGATYRLNGFIGRRRS